MTNRTDWFAMSTKIELLRAAVKAERKALGKAHPETLRALAEACEEAATAIAIDDAITVTEQANDAALSLAIGLTKGSTDASLPVLLKIGRRFTGRFATIADAQRMYAAIRDESGEGASTFPVGKGTFHGHKYEMAYNCRVIDTASRGAFALAIGAEA